MKRLSPSPLVHERTEMEDVTLGAWTEVGADNYLEHVRLGDYSYTCPWCIVQNAEIGKFSNIAAAVRIGPTMHPVDRPTLHHVTYRRAQYGFGEDDAEFFAWRRSRVARIGHDTWLGHGAIVMPGVSVGDGAVIGSGAVVTHDVPAFAVAVGVPARVIRMRFPERVAEALAAVAWWDWPHEILGERLDDLAGPVEAFIERYGGGPGGGP
jgi:phosphonate metabolism protein (transferase hexapeptide repeat family)